MIQKGTKIFRYGNDASVQFNSSFKVKFRLKKSLESFAGG